MQIRTLYISAFNNKKRGAASEKLQLKMSNFKILLSMPGHGEQEVTKDEFIDLLCTAIKAVSSDLAAVDEQFEFTIKLTKNNGENDSNS